MSDEIARIDALTKNARTTWFALLSALIFVGVTLMSVQHIDFYGVDRATQLPLINVSVPTNLFFYTAPVLVAAIYSYFHLYLIRLWDVLASAPGRIQGQRLADAISPWLISDGALYLRASRFGRRDGSSAPRSMELPSALWNLALAWLMGPLVLTFLWWQSMPARDLAMTSIAALSLIATFAFGGASLAMLFARMAHKDQTRPRVWRSPLMIGAALIMLGTVPPLTWSKTSGDIETLARLTLTGEQLTRRPDGWQPPKIARADALANWCKRESPANCKALTKPEQAAFDREWTSRRTNAVADLIKPSNNPLRPDEVLAEIAEALGVKGLWQISLSNDAAYQNFRTTVADHAQKAPDLRNADLRDTFMVGLNLTGALMQGVRASGANLEHADLSFANLSQKADLSGTILTSADMRWAQMQEADLGWAEMQGAILVGAQMQRVFLFAAEMQGANLSGAKMQGADLLAAEMQGANLSGAQIQGADLSWAEMQGAILQFSLLTGSKTKPTVFLGTNLSASINNGGALRFVDLTPAIFDNHTDWRNAFLDASVTAPDFLRLRAGSPCQWQWAADVGNGAPLSDQQFFAMWRGWIKANPNPDGLYTWSRVAPENWRDVTAIPPPYGCTWKTGPLPK